MQILRERLSPRSKPEWWVLGSTFPITRPGVEAEPGEFGMRGCYF